MKRKSYDDDQIERLLKSFPDIHDHQSKESIYMNISRKMDQSKRPKSLSWVLPSVASALVIVMLVLIIPGFFMSMETTDSGGSSEESTDESAVTYQTGSTDPSTDASESSIKIAEPNEEGADSELDQPAVESPTTEETAQSEMVESAAALVADDSNAVTSVYMDPNANVMIPVTWLVDGEVPLSEIHARVNVQELGLLTVEFPYELIIENNRAVAVFPEDLPSLSSQQSVSIYESIKWRVNPFDVDTIQLQTEQGDPVRIGEFGELSDIQPIENGEYMFKLFTIEEHQYLVPVQVVGDQQINLVLEEMKRGSSNLMAPIPAHVNFEQVSSDGTQLAITLSHGNWSNQERILAVESILLTSRQFGFEEVKFNGIRQSDDMTYNFEEAIPVPNAVNPIEVP